MENLGWKLLSRISNFGGGKFGVENAVSNLEFWGWKIWGGKCYLESRIWGGGGKFGVENAISKFLIWGGGKFGAENAISNLEFGWVENLGWKMLSRISNLGGGEFWAENAISNLEFGVWKIWGGKCYLETPIWGGGGGGKFGWKMLSRISNLGCGKFGVENVISTFLNWGGGGGKFGVENAVSNLEFRGWKI